MITISNLSKRFGDQIVLDNLNICIPDHSIFFLLGLNGAGKTTLMKIMVGLLRPNQGEINVVGENTNKNIGNLIEFPVFYDNLTAFQNLKHQSILLNINFDNIAQVLRIVKLDPAGKKKVKKFSLGMRQRLGIARSLLGEHEIIILDEPFNGLDPAGIKEVRTLIKDLNEKQNKTIIISSHLIKETEGLATDYAIIGKNKCLLQFSNEQIEPITTKIECSASNDRIREIEAYLTRRKTCFITDVNGCNIYSAYSNISRIEALLNELINKFHENMLIKQGTIDELFLALTKGSDANVTYN